MRIDPRLAMFGAAVFAAPPLLAQASDEETAACGQACGTACGLGIIGIPLLIVREQNHRPRPMEPPPPPPPWDMPPPPPPES